MSFYGGPYEFFPPVHPRFSTHADPFPHDPHDIPSHDLLPGEEPWMYGPGGHPPPIYPSHHHAAPNPPYAPFDGPGFEPALPMIIDRGVADRPLPGSNLGNSFAVPKGSRNAMHRVITANDSAVINNRNRAQCLKSTAHTVGATTVAPASAKRLSVPKSTDCKSATVKGEVTKVSTSNKPPVSPIDRPTFAKNLSSSPNGKNNVGPSLIVLPAWKRMFEATRVRSQGEVGVVAPVVELASQMLNKRCMQVDGDKRKFTITVDSTIIRRGVLSSRSNEGMTVALYLFQPGRATGGEVVPTDVMLCKMRICVNGTRLLPAHGMSNGVQINLLPALNQEKFDHKHITITIESHAEDFANGFAMICLRRLDPQLHPNGRASAVPSLLRRHSAPVRPPYPLIAPAVGVSKRSASTISASPTVACDPMLARDQSAEKDGSLKRSGTSDPENDDCIEIGDEIVNLICPVALRRIVVPGKGRQCRHVQCFDLETFTNMSRLSPKWKCSVCGDIIEKSDLIVSEPFLHYLAAYPGAERCIIRSNGSHGPYTETMSQMRKKTKVGSKSSPQPDIEVVDLCDDGEESTQSTQPTVVCQPPTPRPNSPSPGMVIENVSQPLLKYAEPAKVDQEQIPLHVPLEASQHSMIWLDRCGENNQSPGDIASAAEGYHCQTDSAHDSAHDDISRMSPEERAALIQRIFADAAEAANQQTGSSSNSPGDEEHDLSMRNGDTDYSSQTRSPRRFGGMVASISSPRADSPSP